MRKCGIMAWLLGLVLIGVWADTATGVEMTPLERKLHPERKLYIVATAHLDTQWRWTIQETIADCIPATLRENFALFEKYPGYTFNFEGSFRYQLMKEYYPEDYARLRREIAAGRWRPIGSWVDAVDVNMPAAEALIRQTLYGNDFFRREFGLTSRDVFLPDCFGFSYALPSIAAHAGLLAFSTQKLTWGSAVGIPFDIGLWEGVDGSVLIAALNPGAYVARVESDLSLDSASVATVERQGASSGIYAGFAYYGTGDKGGAPTDESARWVEQSLNGEGPLKVIAAAPDQLARDLTSALHGGAATRYGADLPPTMNAGLRPDLMATPAAETLHQLPRYKGELLMTDHGAGCYTSQAAMKRLNRKNECMADAAERAAVLAHWLGGSPYPSETLRAAWTRMLWHQFHDDLTGTSIPEAYPFSWDDEHIALNQFTEVLTDATGAITRSLDTRAKGVPLVVYNPLAIEREDLARATVEFPGRAPQAIRVYNPAGQEVPSQIVSRDEAALEILFLTQVPSVGFAVYDVRPADDPCTLPTGLQVTATSLENGRDRVAVVITGDIASIYDKVHARELLSAPLALQLLEDEPRDWAAWEVDYDQVMAPPRTVVGVPVRTRVTEAGPARVQIEVRRTADGSTFTQRLSLGAGQAGDRIEIETEIDWRTPRTLLKAAFPLTTDNPLATYDIGLGTIARGINRPELYEVPGHRWADLTAPDESYGIAILNDCKYGWDRPAEATLRLSLIHTPGVNDGWNWIRDQRSQDIGHHHMSMAIFGHLGSWVAGGVPWAADRFNQPLQVFQAPQHKGALGSSFSLLHVEGGDHPSVAVRAVKLAERSDEVIIRVQELTGRAWVDLCIRFAGAVTDVREVNGAEEPVVGATVPEIRDGRLAFSLATYQPRAFALRLDEPPDALTPPQALPLALPYNIDGISLDTDATDGDFDGAGNTLAGELLPIEITCEGIAFKIGPREPGWANVLACTGQSLTIPRGEYDRIYLLAASVGGDQSVTFDVAGRAIAARIPDYAEPIGQWNNRMVGGVFCESPEEITPAYLKTVPIAWVGNHRHAAGGENEPHVLTRFFKIALRLPEGLLADAPGRLTLPDARQVRILAITAALNENDATLRAQPYYDEPRRISVSIHSAAPEFLETTCFEVRTPNAGAEIHLTLDGSEPTRESPAYGGGISVTETTTVKARAFQEGLDDSYVATLQLTRLVARAPVDVPGPRPGIVCRYYPQHWEKLPDFAAETPRRTDTTPEIRLPGFARPEEFGLAFSGYLQVPRAGLYTLHLWSDDGSALYLGGERLIDHDGLHGKSVKRANVALEAGMHSLRVDFFQCMGGKDLELWIEGPGMKLQPVPAAALVHTADQMRGRIE